MTDRAIVLDQFLKCAERFVTRINKVLQADKPGNTSETIDSIVSSEDFTSLTGLAFCCNEDERMKTAAMNTVVVPVLREKFLRGVVTSKTLYDSGSPEALLIVSCAMQLVDTLCSVFDADWTVVSGPSKSSKDDINRFSFLLVSMCSTIIRSHGPEALKISATEQSLSPFVVRAVINCTNVLEHAVSFLTSDGEDCDSDEDESAWWTELEARTLLSIRSRLLETLADVCEVLSEAPKGGDGGPAAYVLTKFLVQWIVLEASTDDDDMLSVPSVEGLPSGSRSVAECALKSFGGIDPFLAQIRRVHLDTKMPQSCGSLFQDYIKRIHRERMS